MIGTIESYDTESHTGTINYEDDLYTFQVKDWFSKKLPEVGGDVDFVPEDDGTASNIGPVGEFVKDLRPVRNHYVAGILGLILGAAGIHRFYLGFYWLGIAQIILTYITGGMGVVWGFVEGVLILTGHIHKDAKGRFLK